MVVISVVLFLSVVIGVSCQEDAILKMEYTTDDNEPLELLYGNFSPAGPRRPAEGNLFQMHPASFCNVDEGDDLNEMVVVMKLEPPDNMPCVAITLYIKAKRAIKMGAEAIIFITTEDPEASMKLEKDAEEKKILDQPIVIIQGREGQRIMKLVQSQVAARATLEYNENVLLSSVSTPSSKPYLITNSTHQFFNMSIFVAVFVLFAIVCLLVLLKFMWRQRTRQTTTTQLAQNMLSQMKVRKYKRLDQHQRQYSNGCRSVSTLSDGVLCAICLEDFKDGEDIRVVPCGHEFHRRCVDPWLLSNKTCPLCMYNIMELSTEAHLCMAPNTAPDQQIDHNYVQSVRLSAALQRRQNLYSSVSPSGTEQRQSWPGYGRHRSHRRQYTAGSSPRRNENRYNERNATQNDTRVDTTRSSNLCHRCENHQVVMTRSRTKQNTYRQTNSRHNGDRQFVQLPKISNSQSFLQYEALATQLPTGPQYVNPRDQIVHDYLYFYEDCPSDLRETTSLSSLTPSAFHADWEFSDSSRNSGNWDNFDSNQSIYGSCVSLRSDPTPPDPLVYCRPESLLPFQAFENSIQLLPKCVHRTKRYHNNIKKVDSDESKKSSQTKATDISLKVNVSQEGNKRSQRQIAAEKRFTEAATEYEPCLKCAYRRIKRLHEEYTGLAKQSPKHLHRNRYKKTHRSPEKTCNHRTMPYAGHLTNCRRKSGARTKGASKRVHRPGRSQCSPKKSVGDTLPKDRTSIVQSVAVCESERGKVQMLPVHRGTRHLLEALV